MRDLNRILELVGDTLYWKVRDRELFKTDSEWKRWNSRYGGKVAGIIFKAKHSVQLYRRLKFKDGGHHLVHRIVWEMFNGPIPEGMLIDHIDGNGLNNSISNLRLVDSYQSAQNRPMGRNNKSGVVGVKWDRGKWLATISLNGKNRNLGRFVDKEDAIAARKEAERAAGYHENHGRTLLTDPEESTL